MALDPADVALAVKVFQHDLNSPNTRPESASIDTEAPYSEKPQLKSRGFSSKLSWSGVALRASAMFERKLPSIYSEAFRKEKPQ